MSIKTKLWDSSLLTLNDSSGKMNLFMLAIPMFFQQIFTILLGTVNTIVLTKVSDDAVTAINVATSVLNIPNIIMMMPSNGAVIIFSIILGMGENKVAGNIYKTGLMINIVLSVLMGGISFYFAPQFLSIMNVSGTILSNAVTYFRIRAAFLILQAMITYFTGVLRAYGTARPTMISGIIVNLVNALLSIMVVNNIFFSDNKIVGVSYAAVAGQAAGMIYAFCTLKKSRCISEKGRYENSIALRILKVGGPSGLSLLAYNISAMLVTSMITSLGNQAVNTKVFVTNISNYTYLFGYAIAQASSLMVGRLCGAGNIERAKQLYKQNIRFVPVLNVILATVVFIFSDKLMRIFTTDEIIIKTAHYLFLADIVVECFRGMTHIGENSLCGIEDTMFTSVVSILSCFCVSVLFCRIFSINLHMGLFGYYIAAMMDEGFRGLLYRIRWNSGVGFRRFREVE